MMQMLCMWWHCSGSSAFSQSLTGILRDNLKGITSSHKGKINVMIYFKVDRLQMIVVAKKYICVATVHQ